MKTSLCKTLSAHNLLVYYFWMNRTHDTIHTYVWNWAKIGNDENYLLPNKCFRFLASLMPKIQGLLFDQLKNTVCVKSSKIEQIFWKILVGYLLDVFPLYLFVILYFIQKLKEFIFCCMIFPLILTYCVYMGVWNDWLHHNSIKCIDFNSPITNFSLQKNLQQKRFFFSN